MKGWGVFHNCFCWQQVLPRCLLIPSSWNQQISICFSSVFLNCFQLLCFSASVEASAALARTLCFSGEWDLEVSLLFFFGNEKYLPYRFHWGLALCSQSLQPSLLPCFHCWALYSCQPCVSINTLGSFVHRGSCAQRRWEREDMGHKCWWNEKEMYESLCLFFFKGGGSAATLGGTDCISCNQQWSVQDKSFMVCLRVLWKWSISIVKLGFVFVKADSVHRPIVFNTHCTVLAACGSLEVDFWNATVANVQGIW